MVRLEGQNIHAIHFQIHASNFWLTVYIVLGHLTINLDMDLTTPSGKDSTGELFLDVATIMHFLKDK